MRVPVMVVVVLVVLVSNFAFAADKKQVPSGRGPASAQCEALYQSCVIHADISVRARACHAAVSACKNRFTKEDSQLYTNLEMKCANIEKNQTEYGELRADFCRISLVQYIISN